MQKNSLEDLYHLVEFLGSGSFAEVWHGKCNRTGEDVAVKIVDKAKLPNRLRIDSEISIHSALNHPSVVRLFKSFEDGQHVYLVMELCRGGTLQDYLKSRGGQLTENEAQPLFRQIVEGVHYLNSRGIIHRDLSLSNILLTADTRVKISDFGLAKQLHHRDEKHSTMCGTPNFISPEIVTQSPHGLEADTFSLGCILFTLVVGKPPFDTQGLGSTLRRVRRVDFTLPHFLSPQAKDLIAALLKKEPKDRLSLKGILAHHFLQQDQVGFNRNQTAFQGLQDSGLGSTATTFSTTTEEPSRMESRRDQGQLSVILSERSYCSLHSVSKPVQGRGSRCQSLTSECLHQHDQQFRNGPLKVCHSAGQLQQPVSNVSCHSSHRSCSPHASEQPRSVCRSQPGFYTPQKYSQVSGVSPSPTPTSHYPTSNCIPVPVPASPITLDSRWPPDATTLADIMPPLVVQRLKPTQQRTKNAVVSISESGEIILEFLRVRGQHEKVASVCKISPNGMQIVIQRPPKANSQSLAKDTKIRDQSEFTYHNLPKRHWSKYEYAARFLDLVSTKTPKVTFYSQYAKCILMESRQDFEAGFYDGVKLAASGEITKIITCHGESFTLKVEDSMGTLYSEFRFHIEHFRECHEHCINIEGVLALVENKTSKPCFPLTVGKKPASHVSLRSSAKENFPPMSGHDRNAPVPLNTIENQPRSCNASHSKVPRTTSQASLGRNQVIKKIHIPNLGWAQQEKCGKITIQYQDGSELELPGRNPEPILSSPHMFRYRTSQGFSHVVNMSEQLDCDLRKKIECLPVFIRSLEESPILLDIPSCVTSLSGFR